MKSMFESPECFKAYAEIDCAYSMIKELESNLEKYSAKHALEIMIDEATGYSKSKAHEIINQTIECLNLIIENKKIIEADYSKEVVFIGILIERL